ncbi:MAG: carboxypeptidase regulatory-like domain-containing protein, partial [Thermodesulfobacteriota bacterium]|nr:carboxypeptidase regulatory-like domain-containing protein [Thermodesulfobacteriota bacterium]
MTFVKNLIILCLAVFLPASTALSDDGMGSLRIEVKDFNRGTPIEGAEVLVTPCDYTGTTDSRGELFLEEVTPFRNYQVEVQAEGYVSGAAGFVHVDPDKETVATLPLTQKATLVGRITMNLFMGFIRWPLRDAEVKIQEVVDKSFVTRGQTQTDIWGRYSFERLDEGTYRIIAEAEGFESNFVDLEVKGGRTIRQIISLKPQRNNLSTVIASQFALAPVDPTDQLAHNRYLELSSNNDQSINNTDNASLAQIFFNAPEAVPSVIPGPSELPFLYNDHLVFTTSTGSRFVEAGSTVYLRGFAVDKDLLSPQEFNPDAPCFDIYGNKNGNFSASLFGYR